MSRVPSKIVGQSVRSFRTTAGITQEELAELVGAAGETISRIERNKLSASLALTTKLAAALGVGVDALLKPPLVPKKPVLRPSEAGLLNLVRGLDEPQVREITRSIKTLLVIGAARGARRKRD